MPNTRPNHRQYMIESRCPENCTRYPETEMHNSLADHEFIVNEKGEMCLTDDGSNCKKVLNFNQIF